MRLGAFKVKPQPWQFLQCIRVGEYFGYPRCCCIAFASDFIAGRNPFQLRGHKKLTVVALYDRTGTYVPCEACKVKSEKPVQRMDTEVLAGREDT